MSRRWSWVPLAISIALAPRASSASPLFPQKVATTLKIDPFPPCTLCHTTIEGEKGTATKPFARTLIGYGLIAGDTATLGTILEQMKAKGTDDSDGDEVGDIAEIEQGRDPNINDITGKGPDDYPPPSYGCTVRAVAHGRRDAKGGTMLALVALGSLAMTSVLRRRNATRR